MKLPLAGRTHMPFVIGGLLLFCRGREVVHSYVTSPATGSLENVPTVEWQPRLVDLQDCGNERAFPLGGNCFRVCSPFIFPTDTGFRASYIAEKPMGIMSLFSREAATVESLLDAEEKTEQRGGIFCGFSTAGLMVKSTGDEFLSWNDTMFQVTRARSILRLCPYGNKVIITFTDLKGATHSIVWGGDVGEPAMEIVTKDGPVYKCVLAGDTVIHAKRVGDFEERELHRDSFQFMPTEFSIIR